MKSFGRFSRLISSAACFHDITVGSNTFDGIGGYNARQGWDPVTGWGTPDANALVPLLELGKIKICLAKTGMARSV